MKITKAVASKAAQQVKRMSKEMQDKLIGLTINQAIEQNLVTELGDEDGNFIKASGRKDVDAYYAIVNGCAVRVSGAVVDAAETVPQQIGDLTFTGGTSTIEGDGFGKYWFRLGLPQTYNLEETLVKMSAEPVDA